MNDHQWPRIYPLGPLRRPPPALLRFYAAFTLPPPAPTDKKNIASNIRVLCKPIEVGYCSPSHSGNSNSSKSSRSASDSSMITSHLLYAGMVRASLEEAR